MPTRSFEDGTGFLHGRRTTAAIPFGDKPVLALLANATPTVLSFAVPATPRVTTAMSHPSDATIVPDTGLGPLAPGERVVFFGDSITQAGDDPGGYVDLVRRAIAAHAPGQGIGVFGAGVSGNKVRDLEERLHRDVLAKHPTRVVVYIGINDVWHSLRGEGTPKDAFETGLRGLVGRIRDRASRVILCTPSVIGERPVPGNSLDPMLEAYAAVTRSVAAGLQTGLVDLRQAFTAHLAAVNAADRAHGLLTTDGVHLNAAGNRFVADRMLEAFAVTGR
jgi:lysophospholipase L1-like esterase